MLSIDEPVPTPDGWRKHGDLGPEDFVFGGYGNPVKVVAGTRIFTDGDCFEITFSDGTSIKAGMDHIWKVGKRSRKRISGTKNRRILRGYHLMSTREIFEYEHKPDKRLSFDMAAVLDLPEKRLPIDPYVFGAWLGDGSSDGPKITCSYDDYQIIEEISKTYPVKENRSSNENSGLFAFGGGVRGKKGTGLRPLFSKLNVLNNKHIPIDYIRSSAHQRLALVQGLMDTDGHNNTRGTATFVNKNKKLVDDVYELCCTLGLNPKRYLHYIEVNGEPYPVHKVAFQAYKSRPAFRLKRKLERCKDGEPWQRKYIAGCVSIEPEPMSSIQVDCKDGIYLVSKHFLPTHNRGKHWDNQG